MSMTINAAANTSYNTYAKSNSQIATGKTLYNAANNAASMAIYEKMGSLIQGMEQGSNNARDMMSLVQTAEGGLSSINDNLQRVRELSLQAANGTMSGQEKDIIQNEINQLVEGVGSVSSQTEFNGIKLLNGTFEKKNAAISPNGTGQEITIGNMSSGALGISGYNVTQNADVAMVDRAINTVTGERARLGITQNRLASTVNSNSIAEINLASARSRLADTNIAKASTNLQASRIQSQYQMFMQQNSMAQAKNQISILS